MMKNPLLINRFQKSALLGLFLLGLLLPNPCPAAPLPPVITEQPQSQSVEAGGTAIFQVVVTSLASGSYQWRKNGGNIAGATSSTYMIPNVQPGDEADYSVEVSNVHGSTASGSATLAVIINAAPVLDDSKSPALAPVNHDAGAPAGAVGTLVSALVDSTSPAGQLDNVTDPDAGALLGIAVTAADTAHGTWFYSTDNGANWNTLGAVAGTNARLLAADNGTRLYFQPNAGYTGTLTNAIAFRAWDQTRGTNGGAASIEGVTRTVRDLFNAVSYDNNDGTANWTTGWVESESEGGGVAVGNISVKSEGLRIATANANDEIHREADLSGNSSATLNFTYQNSLVSPGSILLQVSGNGGASYSTVMVFDAADTSTGSQSININSYISADTRVRFLVQSETRKSDNIQVDDLEIQYSNSAGSTTAFSSGIDTASLVVNAPPALSAGGSAGMTPEGFSFGLSVPVGATYIIEASDNMSDWIPIATNVADSASTVFTDAAAGNYPIRFYRAVLQ